MKIICSLTLFLLVLVSSCDKEDKERLTDKKDIAYGNDPRQTMDIYFDSANTSSTAKALVVIHGGGWSEGHKNELTEAIVTLRKRLPGYTIFNINYRLAGAGANLFPTQENDVKAAIEFILAHRSEYRLSGSFVYLGVSAGAHLALLQAYKHAAIVNPKAVVSFFGPTDLTSLYNASALARPILTSVTGGTPATNPTIYFQSSPANFVSPQSAPTIILQGGQDQLVPPSQAEVLREKLRVAGTPYQYVFYPSENHGWAGANLDDSFDKIIAFLATHTD